MVFLTRAHLVQLDFYSVRRYGNWGVLVNDKHPNSIFLKNVHNSSSLSSVLIFHQINLTIWNKNLIKNSKKALYSFVVKFFVKNIFLNYNLKLVKKTLLFFEIVI